MVRSDQFAGYGVSYRPEFASFRDELASRIQCMEVLLDDIFSATPIGAECLELDLPIAAHGLSFSPARADFAIGSNLEAMLERARASGVSVLSEHLSLSEVADYAIPNFIAPAKTAAEAQRVARNISMMADSAGIAVAMENPVVFFNDPDDQMGEAAFMNEVSRLSGCGLLLDINNLYINAVNQKCDVTQFFSDLNGDRVTYLHVAGHDDVEGLLLDTHGSDVAPEVWELAELALERTAATALILERDNWTAGKDEIFAEVDRLQDAWMSVRG